MVGESLGLAAIREIGFDEGSWKVRWRRSCDPITDQPSSTSASTAARPIPLDAPVTTMNLVIAIAAYPTFTRTGLRRPTQVRPAQAPRLAMKPQLVRDLSPRESK